MRRARAIHMAYHGNEPVMLEPDDRKHHVFMIGASGHGKTNAMVYMAMQDLIARNSVIFIDPHGEAYHQLLRWMTAMNMGHKKVHLFDLASDTITSFNPLAVRNRSPKVISTTARNLVDAISTIFNEKAVDTPSLQRILGITFHAAIYHGYSLEDVPKMLSTTHVLGSVLRLKCGNEFVEGQLLELDALRKKNVRAYMEEVRSAYNRLSLLLMNPQLQAIFAPSPQSLDLQAIMNNGESLLVNLALKDPKLGELGITYEEARMMGCLLVNEIFNVGQARDKRSPHVMVYLDEFHLFINNKIGDILVESRKRNICLHLANQFLGQLSGYDPMILKNVMQNASSKLIFRMNDMDEASYMAYQTFDFDLKVPKHTLPHVVDYEVWVAKGGSDGETQNRTETATWNDGTGGSRTDTETRTGGMNRTTGTVDNEGEALAKGKGGNKSKDRSNGSSVADQLVNAEKADEYREEYYEIDMDEVRSREDFIPKWRETVPITTTTTSENEREGEGEDWNEVATRSKGRSKIDQTTEISLRAVSRAETISWHSDRGGSVAEGIARSKQRSWNEQQVPVLKDLPVAFWSIEEMKYQFGKLLQKLGKGQAIYRSIEGDAHLVEFDLVSPYSHVKSERLEARLQSIYERQPSIVRRLKSDELRNLEVNLFGPPALPSRPSGDGQVVDEPEGW